MTRRIRLALFAASLAAATANGPLRAQAATRDSQAPAAASAPAASDIVTADRDRSERLTVPVTINGQGPYRFLIDTGAQATVVTARVIDALGLVPDCRATLIAMASRASVDTITLDGLEFAGRRFDNLTAPLLRDRDIGADGIIGLDTLQDLRVILDFRADTIRVSDGPIAGGGGYDIVVRARRQLGQMIITNARIDGVRTAVIIDTGSWHSVGNLALSRKLRAREGGDQFSTDVTGAQVRSTIGVVRELKIGPLVLGAVPIGFTDSPAFAALALRDTPALILGIGNLRPFDRVAIDFATRRILFDVPQDAYLPRMDSLFEPSRAIRN